MISNQPKFGTIRIHANNQGQPPNNIPSVTIVNDSDSAVFFQKTNERFEHFGGLFRTDNLYHSVVNDLSRISSSQLKPIRLSEIPEMNHPDGDWDPAYLLKMDLQNLINGIIPFQESQCDWSEPALTRFKTDHKQFLDYLQQITGKNVLLSDNRPPRFQDIEIVPGKKPNEVTLNFIV